MIDARSAIAVALGAGIGGLLRYVLAVAFAQRLGPGFPWGTLFINVSGSFLIGVVIELSRSGLAGVTPLVRTFAATGILGGYTTFSTYSFEIVTLEGDGATGLALAYALGSMALGFGAAYLGVAAVRALAPAGT